LWEKEVRYGIRQIGKVSCAIFASASIAAENVATVDRALTGVDVVIQSLGGGEGIVRSLSA
jgi:hypothetical protein